MIDIRTISDISHAVRGRRHALKVSQDDLATRAGVSRKWIYEFEAGKPGAELGITLAVLDALGLTLTLATNRDLEPAGQVDLDALLDEYGRS